MKGIAFGNLHTYRDLKMILTHKTIGTPTPKTEYLDIPGGDGMLDMTEFFGEVKYGNRPITYEFSTAIPYEQFPAFFSRVQNALHGQKVPIVDDDDPDYYYMGRITVSEFQAKRTIGTLTIECDCEPYKYKMARTVVSKAITSTDAITLTNGRKRAVPTITTTAAMTIAFGNGTWTNSAGTYTIPELELIQGENVVTVTGNGTITFAWQEGDL